MYKTPLKSTTTYIDFREINLDYSFTQKIILIFIWAVPLNPLTSTSDQDRISPYNINTISTRKEKRIKKYITLGIISWSNTKFTEHT